MKYTAATFALLAGLSAAHDSPFGDAVPHCAVDCLVAGIESIGCDVEDPACACTPENQAALASPDFISCLTEACSPEEVADAATGGGAICNGVGPSGTAEGSATETESAGGEPTASSGEGNSTSTTASGEAEPTGDEGDEDEGSSGDGEGSSGDDEGSDADEDAGSGDEGQETGDEGAAAAFPAIFGGAAVLAAVLAL